jgi:hypothetical protein
MSGDLVRIVLEDAESAIRAPRVVAERARRDDRGGACSLCANIGAERVADAARSRDGNWW